MVLSRLKKEDNMLYCTVIERISFLMLSEFNREKCTAWSATHVLLVRKSSDRKMTSELCQVMRLPWWTIHFFKQMRLTNWKELYLTCKILTYLERAIFWIVINSEFVKINTGYFIQKYCHATDILVWKSECQMYATLNFAYAMNRYWHKTRVQWISEFVNKTKFCNGW